VRVAFAGSPPFAVAALEALLAAGHSIPLVLAQPDRPSGRGMVPTACAVAAFARGRGLTLHQPVSLRDPEAREPLARADSEVLVVAAYGLILPQAVLDMPPQGCLNIHASLLPRWRGAAPVARAILEGDAETGVCIMRMEAGLDTGPVLHEKRTPIGADETTAGLTGRLARLGAQAIVEVLENVVGFVPRAQDSSRATYAAKIGRAEAPIDWNCSNVAIHRQVRGLDPFPGAETQANGGRLKVWAAELADGKGPAGKVLSSDARGLTVACSKGALTLTCLQRSGGRRLPAAEFLKGTPIPVGSVLG
jgi:methionyl-tRNA formyltransferase